MTEKKIMTPDEFEQAIKEIYPSYDPEQAHADSDAIMEDLLASLGYEAGIEILRSQTRWYA